LRKVDVPPRKYRRYMMSHPFYCSREDAVASQEVERVQDITSSLLHAEDAVASHELEKVRAITFFFSMHGIVTVSYEVQKVHDITSFLLLAGRCRDLPGNTEGAKHHNLSVACGKIPRYPRNYRRYMIDITSFFCLREDVVASQEVHKVQDITSFILLAERCRGLPGTTESA
jgi:hypothetical protein